MRYIKYIFLLAIFVICISCGNDKNTIAIDEVLVTGDDTVIYDETNCNQYLLKIDDLYVSKYEFTWKEFSSVINYGLKKKYIEIKDTELYPLVGSFPQFNKIIIDVSKNADTIAIINGKIVAKESSLKKPMINVG